MSSAQAVGDLVSQPYKYGFVTDIETEKIAKGLSEDVVRLISSKKQEPAFLLDFRLRAYREGRVRGGGGLLQGPVVDHLSRRQGAGVAARDGLQGAQPMGQQAQMVPLEGGQQGGLQGRQLFGAEHRLRPCRRGG